MSRDREIVDKASGFRFKQSELVRIITELAAFDVRFDDEGTMATFNHVNNQWEKILQKDITELIFERRGRLRLDGYRRRKVETAVKLCLYFVKKTGQCKGWLEPAGILPDNLPIMEMDKL